MAWWRLYLRRMFWWVVSAFLYLKLASGSALGTVFPFPVTFLLKLLYLNQASGFTLGTVFPFPATFLACFLYLNQTSGSALGTVFPFPVTFLLKFLYLNQVSGSALGTVSLSQATFPATHVAKVATNVIGYCFPDEWLLFCVCKKRRNLITKEKNKHRNAERKTYDDYLHKS